MADGVWLMVGDHLPSAIRHQRAARERDVVGGAPR